MICWPSPYGVGERHHERRRLCDVGVFSFVRSAAERIIKPVPALPASAVRPRCRHACAGPDPVRLVAARCRRGMLGDTAVDAPAAADPAGSSGTRMSTGRLRPGRRQADTDDFRTGRHDPARAVRQAHQIRTSWPTPDRTPEHSRERSAWPEPTDSAPEQACLDKDLADPPCKETGDAETEPGDEPLMSRHRKRRSPRLPPA